MRKPKGKPVKEMPAWMGKKKGKAKGKGCK